MPESPSPWRSAAKVGLVAAVVPMIVGLVLSLTMDEGAQEGIGWIFIVGILAAPVIFLLGAATGLLAHLARARIAVVPVQERPARWIQVVWLLAGATAGYDVSQLTAFQWPILGGVLIGMALIPAWTFVGATLGQRVAVGRGSSRAVIGSAIAAGVAHAVASTVVHYSWLPLDQRSYVVVGIGAIAGAFTYYHLRKTQ